MQPFTAQSLRVGAPGRPRRAAEEIGRARVSAGAGDMRLSLGCEFDLAVRFNEDLLRLSPRRNDPPRPGLDSVNGNDKCGAQAR
jgi:hypothetical protein